MIKDAVGKLRTGAMVGLAGLALGATSPKAKAVIQPEIATTISAYNVDMDDTRDGIQVRYDWAIKNLSPPAESYTADAVFKYAVSANLDEKGMYGFSNESFVGGDSWTYTNGDDSSFDLATGSYPIRLNVTRTFSALIDQNLIIGNEQVTSTAIANSSIYFSDVTVPITRQMTTTNGVTFGWLKDHNLVDDTNSTASYAAAALVDTDGDGFANWQEYVADSDPNSSNSFFRVTVSGSGMSWHSATGRVYTINDATNLTDTFTFITNFTGIAGTLSYTNAGTDDCVFYRLEATLSD